jgi:aminopeptidase N
MKKFFLLIVYFISHSLFSQDYKLEANDVYENEKQWALKKIKFRANPATQNYDITYHKLEFTINPAVRAISGKVTTTFTALSDLSTLTFDLANELEVSTVTQGGSELNFNRSTNNELIITLKSILIKNSTETLEITYSGIPPQNGFGSFEQKLHAGVPIIWTLSEPFGARDWWPCKQDLNDKISSIDVFITAPSQYTSVSNGLEQSQTIEGENKITHFKHNYPIPFYLICLAITNYEIFNQQAGQAGKEFPIVNYLYPETAQNNKVLLEKTVSIMNFFETTFETYPFANEKYGHAQCGFGGGMEHTTVSFMGNFNRQLIAHELAHQWFGDKITCSSWNDIWLNEGFATYLASLVIERLDGEKAFIEDKKNMIQNITGKNDGAIYLTDNESATISEETVNRIFDQRLSYNKGAMVLNMLRFLMTEVPFNRAIKNYLTDANLAYANAKTENLKMHLEAVYGKSLDEFFNDWVYNQGFPTYIIDAKNDKASGRVVFTVNQRQSHPSVSFFEMPVPIRMYGKNGDTKDITLQVTENNQEFIEDVPFTFDRFEFDPEKNLIAKSREVAPQNPISFLMPNPAIDELSLESNFDFSIQKAVFYTILGQKVRETTTQTSWDVSSFTPGIYFIDVTTSDGNKKYKLVKN